jgi:acyl carrier protein
VGFIFAFKRLNQGYGPGRRASEPASGPTEAPEAPAHGKAADQGSAFSSLIAADPDTEVNVTENPQDKANLVNEIIEVIAAEGMVDRSKITPDATIESLDLKSVDIVMILTALEEKFNVYIPMDGSLQEAKDVKTLIDAIADHIVKEREKN